MLIRILKFFLLLTVFTIPLIPACFGFGYELIKVLVFLALTTIAGFIFLHLLSKKTVKIRWTKIKISALIFFCVLSLTAIFGIHPLESLIGKYPYYQGLVLYWFLFLFYLMVSETGINLKKLGVAVVYPAVVVAITAIFQFIQIDLLKIEGLTYAGRVISTFGQPNLFSGFLLLALPFASKLKKYRYWAILIISLGILVSLSKAAILILLGLVLVILYQNTKHKGLLAFGIMVVLINALVFSVNQSSGLVWDEVLRPLAKTGPENYQVEKRIYILPVMLEIYARSPLLGYGIDSINVLYKGQFSGFKPELKNYPPLYFNLMNLTIDRSHNYFLDLLIFSGVLGLMTYIYLLYLLFKSKVPAFLKIFLALYIIWVQFQVQSIVHLMLFWLVVGTIDNVKKFNDDKS